MFKCTECGYEYDEPITINFCYEDECGVGSMFPDMHYGEREVCPRCECDHYWSETIDEEEAEIQE